MTGCVFGIADLAVFPYDIGILNKQVLLGVGQLKPVPITDGIVKLVLMVVDDQLLTTGKRLSVRVPVSILVWHDVKQLHRAVRGSGDGQRNIHRLAVGIGSPRIGRDILVVDID